jgi:molybdate/tungstate transport system permease protein
MTSAAERVGKAPALLLTIIGILPLLGFFFLLGTPVLAAWQTALAPLLTSLAGSLAATLATVALGTPAAFALARARSRSALLFEAFWLFLLVTPPLVLGLLLALVFGPYAPLGRLVGDLGLSGTNSFFALVLATFFESAPYYVLGALGGFASLPPALEESALALGLPPGRVFLRVVLPEALPALVMAASMSWARAMGAFGAVLIVAYHPYGLPVWTWVELETSGLQPALAVALLLSLVAVPWPLIAWGWTKRA